jgi:hypothetical protein
MIESMCSRLVVLGICVAVCINCSAERQAGVEQETARTKIANGDIEPLQPIVEEFLPEGYVLDVKRDQHDPYRWQSSGCFTGVTFYLKGDEAWQKREGKKRPCVYITFMPEAYDGKPASTEDQGKFQVASFSAKFLGWRGPLRVYACRDFGYSLPDNGELSENNLRKLLNIKKEKESTNQP